jgi:HAD superfamily hydrolase (TIGR01490 family)
MAREAAFARRGEGVSTAQRLLATLLASVAGREAAPYLTVARDLGDELATAAVPGARWLLDMHLAVGDFCVIVSASPQELVEAAARALGAHRAVGTRTQLAGGCFTGRLEGPFCHGRGKLARLWVELGTADLSQATAYSDSASDLPMLKAAGRPVAVNPDRRLRRAAVAAGWPVVRLA